MRIAVVTASGPDITAAVSKAGFTVGHVLPIWVASDRTLLQWCRDNRSRALMVPASLLLEPKKDSLCRHRGVAIAIDRRIDPSIPFLGPIVLASVEAEQTLRAYSPEAEFFLDQPGSGFLDLLTGEATVPDALTEEQWVGIQEAYRDERLARTWSEISSLRHATRNLIRAALRDLEPALDESADGDDLRIARECLLGEDSCSALTRYAKMVRRILHEHAIDGFDKALSTVESAAREIEGLQHCARDGDEDAIRAFSRTAIDCLTRAREAIETIRDRASR